MSEKRGRLQHLSLSAFCQPRSIGISMITSQTFIGARCTRIGPFCPPRRMVLKFCPSVRSTAAGKGEGNHGNIMFDRRVVRGNTYARPTLTKQQLDPLLVQGKAAMQRKSLTRKRASTCLPELYTPEPVDDRLHKEMQTDMYLEQLTEFIETTTSWTQTDIFMDQPPRPLFIPVKVGVDRAIQLDPHDLFDWELEVTVIIDMLTARCVEQGLREIAEEDEIQMIRDQIHEFEIIRNSDLVEKQRIEEQQRRHVFEKEVRVKERVVVNQKMKDLKRRIAATAFAHCYMEDLMTNTFCRLQDERYFFDDVERDVERGFLKLLTHKASELADLKSGTFYFIDGVLLEIIMEKYAMTSSESSERAYTDFSDDTDDLDGIRLETREVVMPFVPRVQIILPEEAEPDDDESNTGDNE